MPRKVKSKSQQKMEKIAQKVYKKQSALNTEMKYKQNNYAWSLTTAGNLDNPLSQINQGLDSNERVGQEVRLVKHTLRLNLTNGDATNSIRYGLVYTNSPVTSVSQILNNLIPLSTNSGFDPEVVSRVLVDKLVTLNAFYSGGTSIKHNVIKKKDRTIIKWDSNVAGALPVKGHLYFFAISDSSVGPNPRLTASLMTHYTDE